MMLTVHTIKLDTDEGRFTLSLGTYGDEGTIVLDIHDAALQLYEQVRRELLPYVLEAEQARATLVSPYDEADAYDLSDPKSPGFHDRIAAAWDNREEK